jgi:hypothetical protein
LCGGGRFGADFIFGAESARRKKGMKKALEEAALANEMTVESAAHERAKRERTRERERERTRERERRTAGCIFPWRFGGAPLSTQLLALFSPSLTPWGIPSAF